MGARPQQRLQNPNLIVLQKHLVVLRRNSTASRGCILQVLTQPTQLITPPTAPRANAKGCSSYSPSSPADFGRACSPIRSVSALPFPSLSRSPHSESQPSNRARQLAAPEELLRCPQRVIKRDDLGVRDGRSLTADEKRREGLLRQ